MTQLSLIVNSLPRDLLEFTFFLVVGFTAGSIGLVWLIQFKVVKKFLSKKIIYIK